MGASHQGPSNQMSLKYRRILLKLSGEALMGEDAFGISRQTIERIAHEIRAVHQLGVELAVVIGGGNIFRGVAGGAAGMDRRLYGHVGHGDECARASGCTPSG